MVAQVKSPPKNKLFNKKSYICLFPGTSFLSTNSTYPTATVSAQRD